MTAAVLDGVQAHVLRPVSRELTRSVFYFLKLDDPYLGRRLLRRLLDEGLTLSDAEAHRRRSRDPVRCHVAIGFTRDALERLGHPFRSHPLQVPEGEADPFCEGMAARANLLGDPDTARWPGTGCNMLLWVADAADGSRRHDVDRIIDDSDIRQLHVDAGSHDGDGPVVLGFRDGTSQPFLTELSSERDRLPGGGTWTPDGWRPIPIGEFVLGSTDAGGERLIPEPAWLATGGTFLVYRKYRFERRAFDEFLKEAGDAYDRAAGRPAGGAASVAAKVVGRYRVGESPPGWPEGHDAVVSPVSSGGTAPRSPNDFRYGEDTYGHACPLGAHIRRANPRDALGFDGRLTQRHRIIRRGVPWEQGDGQGLHFVGVNARINDQFEFIQRQWLNSGHAFRLGADIDLLAGSWTEPDTATRGNVASFVIQGRHPIVVRATRPFTEMQGGDYFLMPGIEGLRQLARKA